MEQIPQLKWHLMAKGTSLINESEMAALILDVLVRMCKFYPSRDSEGGIVRPLPRAKRLLSEPNTLPHVVQLLLTFDPRLVEKVVTLLNVIMEVSSPLLSLSFSPCSIICVLFVCHHRTILSYLEYSQLVSSSSFSCTLAPTFFPLQSSSSILT